MSKRPKRTGQEPRTPAVSLLPQDRTTDYTIIDLFSGAGGMSCGFWQAGFNIKGAIDKQVGKPDELTPCNGTYSLNFGLVPDEIDLLDDKAGDPKEYLKSKGMKPQELTVLISCPPCTGYSQKNFRNHGQDDPRNALVYKTKGFVEAFRPEFLVMENVPEMFQGNNRHHFRALYDDLKTMGYSVFVDEFDFADFGLPQHRKRAIVLARRDNGSVPDLRQHLKGTRVTIEQALTDKNLKALSNGEQDSDDPVHVCPNIGKRADRVLNRCLLIRRCGGRWTNVRREAISDQEWSYLTPRIQAALLAGDTKTFPDCYGTALKNKPSNTIIRQCGDIGTGPWFHWEQDRMLSAREMAILQGFPYEQSTDGEQPFYRFAGTPAKIYQQVGNAVPPLVSRLIAEEIVKLLRGETRGLQPNDFPPPGPLLDGKPEQLRLTIGPTE
jgi:DNA (cytosine-5)-methyltransferase 1